MNEFIPALVPFLKEKKRYKFVWGGRGGGKSTSIADILLFKGRRKTLRILCTREIQKSIKDSVHTLLEDRIKHYDLDEYDVKQNEIVNELNGTEFLFTGLREHNVSSIKSYEGIDLCWVEEAQAVTQKSLDILTPTIRKKDSEIWFSYNRLNVIDPVNHLCMRECVNEKKGKFTENGTGKKYRWSQFDGDDAIGIYINYDGNPYFPDVLKKEMLKDKRDNYNLYLHKWEGQPQQESGDILIPLELVMKSMKLNVEKWDYVSFGIDPARYGEDESVICHREGFIIHPFLNFRGINTMKLSGMIIELSRSYYLKGYKKPIPVKIDDSGLGGGVTDRLQELQELEQAKPESERTFNIQAIPVMNNEKATDNSYYNYGTQMWGELKKALKTVRMVDDNIALNQITNRKYKIWSDGRIRLESKDDMKKRGLKSPDRADALVLCLADKASVITEDYSNNDMTYLNKDSRETSVSYINEDSRDIY